MKACSPLFRMAQGAPHLPWVDLGRRSSKSFRPELYAHNMALIYIGTFIIIPSAVGVLLTGLFYARFTKWVQRSDVFSHRDDLRTGLAGSCHCYCFCIQTLGKNRL
jgi:hypothetical protein